MMNHATTEVFFDDLRIPADEPGRRGGSGLPLHPRRHERRTHSDRRRVRRRRALVHRARPRAYAREREVFGRPIGQNQGVAVPDRAGLRRHRGRRAHGRARRRDCSTAAQPCGAEANMAKLLASEASWKAADMCMQTHGGYGFAEEYDVERKFRETRLYQIAPVSTNLVLSYLAEHVLGLPRSY